MSFIDDMGLQLADKALAEAAAADDPKLVDRIADMLGASSQSLEEAFLTGIRVRRAEARAKEMIADSQKKRATPTPNANAAAG